MSQTKLNVHVDLSERSYDIEIGTGVLDSIGQRVQSVAKVSNAVIITDDNVEPYAQHVGESLVQSGSDVNIMSVDPGEPSKSVAVAASLWNEMRDAGVDRKSVVFAVGGGVVGDLAGFAAAAYARGIPFVQVPTTLLAQVDSSVGGKVGVNLKGAKNMVGAFWQPLYVMIDTDVLSTLPDREYRSGLAEVVKYGVILDADFFEYLEQNVDGLNERHADVLRQVVSRCCQLKADVVQQDEREETGLRAVLNYGHTFAHALEAITGYGQLLHGEAVSIGMLCASRLSVALGRIDAEMTERQFQLLSALKLPTDVPDVDRDEMAKLMLKDKKVEHGKLRFVLPTRMGHVELVGDVDMSMAKAAI